MSSSAETAQLKSERESMRDQLDAQETELEDLKEKLLRFTIAGKLSIGIDTTGSEVKPLLAPSAVVATAEKSQIHATSSATALGMATGPPSMDATEEAAAKRPASLQFTDSPSDALPPATAPRYSTRLVRDEPTEQCSAKSALGAGAMEAPALQRFGSSLPRHLQVLARSHHATAEEHTHQDEFARGDGKTAIVSRVDEPHLMPPFSTTLPRHLQMQAKQAAHQSAHLFPEELPLSGDANSAIDSHPLQQHLGGTSTVPRQAHLKVSKSKNPIVASYMAVVAGVQKTEAEMSAKVRASQFGGVDYHRNSSASQTPSSHASQKVNSRAPVTPESGPKRLCLRRPDKFFIEDDDAEVEGIKNVMDAIEEAKPDM